MTQRLKPYLILAGLGLLFFAELVLHPTQTLYSDHSDLLAFYLPVKHHLVRSWQETAEVPLWNPYSFGGAPFVADIQVAAFYPPQAVLYLVPEQYLGAAMSWLLVVHVIAAGCCMYAYARSQGLGPTAALVAALGYMLAGKWLLHLLEAGHCTFAPLAWLPLVLLWLEAAVRRAGQGETGAALVRATWAGTVFGVMLLGTQPQLTFYAGLFIGLWTLGPVLEQAGYLGAGGGRSWRRTGRALGRWLGLGAWTVAVAVGLAAVQLLPTLDATRETTRAVTGAPDEPAIRSVVEAVVNLVGPPLAGPLWDPQGGLGVVWVMTAVLAPLLVRSGRVRFQSAVCLLLVLFAVGGGIALRELPGFRLFRVPARMMLIGSLPVALLAGTTTQALLAAPPPAPVLRRCRRVMLGVLALAGLCLVGGVLLTPAWGRALQFHVYWVVLPLIVAAALWLTGKLALPGSRWPLAWTVVLAAELWALACPLVRVRPEADLYAPAQCVDDLARLDRAHGRVLDRDAGRLADTPLGFALPLLLRIEPVRGYCPFDVHRYKEYVQFISDRDDPVRPLEGILNFETRNRALLDLLGTRYLLQPTYEAPPGEGWRVLATDREPRAFCFITGGLARLPPYTVYENEQYMPRAFVVPEAAPLPERKRVLAALKAADFRRTVLLEGFTPPPQASTGGGTYRKATIADYGPNRVVVTVDGTSPGYLVVTDLSYPGWSCAVDGDPTRLYRANFLFRGVAVPAGAHEVVFTFAPVWYARGKVISGATLAAVLGVTLLAAAAGWVRRRTATGR